MSTRRLFALLIALLAIFLLASIPFLIARHVRASSSTSLGAVANGTVIAIERDGRTFTMVVEFQVFPGAASRRIRSTAETVGLLSQQPRQRPGDPVLVAYDPSNPSVAHVFNVRSVWQAIVRRGILALLLLVAAVLLLRASRPLKNAPAQRPPA